MARRKPAFLAIRRTGYHRRQSGRTGHRIDPLYGLCSDISRACDVYLAAHNVPKPKFVNYPNPSAK